MNATITRLAAVLLLAIAGPTIAETRLVMVEQDGCHYCARWHDQIAPIYPRTDYAEAAPLRVMDIDDLPGDLALAGRVVFTPTFLLVVDGTEIARAEGYAGEELFWMHMELLRRRLAAHQSSDPTQ